MTDSNKGLRILIIEDNPDDQYLITGLLTASVIKIQLFITAETLGKAVDILEKEIFDIILLDLTLPDSSGIDTFKVVKKFVGKMPVIILSGISDMNVAVEAIALGAQDYHIKGDMDEKTLTKTILYSIERKRKTEYLQDDNERYVTISKAEHDLMQSEEITRQVMYAALDAIVCADAYGKIFVWNQSAEKIFGWKQHEIIGKSLSETIIPAEYRERHEKGMKHYLATGEGPILNKLIEITAVNSEGKLFPVELTLIPLIQGGARFFCAFIRDISERKKAENELQESERFLNRAQAVSKIGSYVFDFTTGIWKSSSESDNIFGFTSTDKHTVDLWVSVLHPDHRSMMTEYFENEVIGKKQRFDKEYKIINKISGKECWVHGIGDLESDSSGNLVCMLGVIQDITERKKAEEELLKEKDFSDSIINNLPGIFTLYDNTGKILRWNKNSELVSGYSNKEISGMNVIDFFEAEEKQFVTERSIEIFKNGKGDAEANFLTKNGEKIPCHFTGFRVIYENKPCVVGLGFDLTERKKAEAELKRSNERFELIGHATDDAIWELNLETNEAWSNETHQHLFGLTKDDPVPGPEQWKQQIHPDDRERIIKSHSAGLASLENVWKNEYRFYTNKGELKNINGYNYIVRNEAGSAIRIMGAMVDFSERKKAEQAVKESEEKYRTLVEQAVDAIVLYDATGKILDVNTGSVRLLGYTNEELIQMYLSDILTAEEIKEKPVQYDVLQTGASTVNQRMMRRKDGSVVQTEKISQQLPDGRFLSVIRDLTDRIKAQEQIEREKELSDSIINSLPGLFYLIDETGKEIRWNKLKEDISGYTAAEISRMNCLDFFEGEEKELIRQRIKDGFANGTTNVEAHFVTKAGKRILFYFTGIAIEYEGKKCLLGTGIDISERKKAEEELMNERNLLRALIDNLPDYIYVKDAEFNYIINNRAFVKLAGATSEAENTRKNSIDLFGEEIGQINMEEDRKIVETGETVIDRDEPIVTRDGKKLWLLTTKVPLKDKKEKVTGILGISKDITGRKEAERLVKESEEKYRTLVEQAVDAIVLYDVTGKILDVNTGSVRLLGYTNEELIQMYLSDVLTAEEIKAKPVQYDVLQTGASTVKQRMMRKKDGSVVQTEVRSQQLPDGRFLSVVRDLTDRKKAEQELEESYKAIRKLTEHLQNIREEERAHIAREIHDELGQQLTVMKMDISWINKKIGIQDEPVKARMKELLLMLDETVKSVRRISSQLRPSLLDDLGLTAAMEWHLTEFEKRFDIKTSFKPDDAEIKMSESMKTGLFRIFQESLTNVARHSKAKKVTVTLYMENGSIVLSVADNGVGFDKQNTIGKKTLGILGMQERTSMMGGSYEIRGKPGKGTRVVARIPLVDNNKN